MNKRFIVIEGLDRSGKTTISKILCDIIPTTVGFSFPNRKTHIGKLLDSYLKNQSKIVNKHELHLLFSANRYNEMGNIAQSIKRNHVVCDRYWYSGTCYSVANGLDYEWCKDVDRYLIEPDVVFFIDIDADGICQQEGFGKEINDDVNFQEKVYNAYKKMIKTLNNIVVINGNQKLEEISRDIIAELNLLFNFNIHVENGYITNLINKFISKN